ncbi:MAG: 1-deoxy-D-xylulose-5-phosphate reductoisomerase, partial [Algoriphagus sp.]
REEVGFLEMSDLIAETLAKAEFIAQPSLEDYVGTDLRAREITQELIQKNK